MNAAIIEQILRDWRNDLISGVFFPLLPLVGIGIIHFGRWKGKKRVWMVLLLA